RVRKSLLVQVDGVQGILNGRLLLRLQVANLGQNAGDRLERIAVFFCVCVIVQQEEVALGAARFEHLDRSLLSERGRGRVHAYDAIHNPAHLKQIVDCGQNNWREYQSHDGQAQSDPPAQRHAGRENREGPSHDWLHLHPPLGTHPYLTRKSRFRPLAYESYASSAPSAERIFFSPRCCTVANQSGAEQPSPKLGPTESPESNAS